MSEDRLIIIGKIVGVHGIKGDLKLASFAEDLSIFEPESDILLKDSLGTELKTYRIKRVKPHKKGALLSLEDVENRTDGESLVGSELIIPRDELPEIEDAFYWADLMGLTVRDLKQGNLGTVTDIIQTGSNDVYVVRDEESNEVLIPALESVVKEIDLDLRLMKVDLPEGL